MQTQELLYHLLNHHAAGHKFTTYQGSSKILLWFFGQSPCTTMGILVIKCVEHIINILNEFQ